MNRILFMCVLFFFVAFAPVAPAMESAGNTFTVNGSAVHVSAGNFWAILGKDGKKYDPGNLPEAFQREGLAIEAELASVKPRPARMWGKPVRIVRLEASEERESPSEHAHEHHHHAVPAEVYQRSERTYVVPNVRVQEATQGELTSAGVFDTDKAVVVSFIFTSCTAICPILTSTLVQARKQLGDDVAQVRVVSISIDPEYDTPARLRDYARRFGVDGDWHFLTGDVSAIREIQRAFDADRGDKNNHQPLALLRPAGGEQWVRLDGFTSAKDLVKELRNSALN